MPNLQIQEQTQFALTTQPGFLNKSGERVSFRGCYPPSRKLVAENHHKVIRFFLLFLTLPKPRQLKFIEKLTTY
jgi:hypothetical protein